jgi:hypothetical protein
LALLRLQLHKLLESTEERNMRLSQRTNPASAATSPRRALPAHLHDVRSRPQRPLVRALKLALLGAGLSTAIVHAAPPVIPLSALDGNNGFRLDGVASEDYSGAAVSGVGDINGDGIDDLIIGAYGAGGFSGRSYVVFGRSAGGFTSTINLSALDGGNGFRLDGLQRQCCLRRWRHQWRRHRRLDHRCQWR